MKKVLARRWFLLCLLGEVSLAMARPYWLAPWLTPVPPLAVVAPALFLMSLGLDSRSLVNSLAHPLPALWAVILSYVPLPVLGWLGGRLLSDPDLRLGLLVITSVPCTLASVVIWTRRAGGSEATALLVVLLSTSTSWLATTAWMVWGTGMEQISLSPLGMMRQLLLALVLPVGLGQVARRARSVARAAARFRTAMGVLAQFLILTIIFKAAVDVRLEFGHTLAPVRFGWIVVTAALCLGIHLTAWAVGFWSSRFFRFERGVRIAVGFACSQKTLPVALLLFETYFSVTHPLAIVPLACYHFGQLIVDTFIADRLASRPAAEAEMPVAAAV